MSDRTNFFSQTMYPWFLGCGRDLPWRHAPSAYEVWVSELMLQQTQVATVIPYYERWMARFPGLSALARADLDDVLGLWAGLGYYRRARYLYDGARYLTEHCGGEFPRTVDALRKIPGVGSYTAGAIASFAFGLDVPAVDGNAERVLSRYFGIDGDPGRGEARKNIEAAAQKIAALGHAREVNQAIMDLGADICGRMPCCDRCPVAAQCFAKINGRTESLPQKKARPEKMDEFRAALVLHGPEGRILAGRRNGNMLLGGLWEFPMIRTATGKGTENREKNFSLMRLPRTRQWTEYLSDIFDTRDGHIPEFRAWTFGPPSVEHIFTHIRMHIAIDAAYIDDMPVPHENRDYDGFEWIGPEALGTEYAISTLMKKICGQLRTPYQKTLDFAPGTMQ